MIIKNFEVEKFNKIKKICKVKNVFEKFWEFTNLCLRKSVQDNFFLETLTAQNRRYHWRIFYLCISRFREKSSEGQDKAALHTSPILDRSSIQLNLRHDNLKIIISFTRKFRKFRNFWFYIYDKKIDFPKICLRKALFVTNVSKDKVRGT